MMKTEQVSFVLVCLLAYAKAYAPSSSFFGKRAVTPCPVVTAWDSGSRMRMDTEMDVDRKAIESLERILRTQRIENIDQAEARHGMPWKSSIDPKCKQSELLYMPFWEWHMSFMKENLSNLRVLPCSNGEIDFSYNENKDKKARIANLCFESDEYRKIRLTYYDAGDNTQVYNAVFYPDPKYNLPVLGIDLLAFNRKKFLTIVDFQPIHTNEEDHAAAFEHRLKPIKERYESLKGRMSAKFYDETQFFSQQMLFARFEDEQVISRDLFPAFKDYVQTHLDLIRGTKPDPFNVQMVMERQKAYDTYSAERDPATGLFAAMYGNDWAQAFVHDFLFSCSERKTGAVAMVRPAVASTSSKPTTEATTTTYQPSTTKGVAVLQQQQETYATSRRR